MKKRLYALLFALLLLFAAFPLGALAAGEGDAPELTLSCERAGDALRVTVGLENAPGIAGFDLALRFNADALTPSCEPTMADGWGECAVTNYAAPFSGNTLRVAAARQTDIRGDALFTVTFAVTGDGFGLSVEGAACTEREEEIALSRVYADALTVSAARTVGGVTLTVVSSGNAYHGAAKAILARYRDGRFVGCVTRDVTVAENGETNVTLTVSGGQTEEWRLLLLDTAFCPVAEAKTLPAAP